VAHTISFSLSLSPTTTPPPLGVSLSLSLSLSLSFSLSPSLSLSLLSIPNPLNNNNINNSRAETSLGGQNDSQWDEAWEGLTQPLETPSLTPPPPLLPPPPDKHIFVIRDFEYVCVCVCVCVCMRACTLSWLTLRTLTGFIQDALARQGSWHCVWHHTPVAVFDVFTPLLRERGTSPQMQIQDRRKRTGKVRKREEVLEKYDWCSLSGLGLTLPCFQVSAKKVCSSFHTVRVYVCVCVCVCVCGHLHHLDFYILAKGRWEGNETEKKGKWVSWGRREGGESKEVKPKGEGVREREEWLFHYKAVTHMGSSHHIDSSETKPLRVCCVYVCVHIRSFMPVHCTMHYFWDGRYLYIIFVCMYVQMCVRMCGFVYECCESGGVTEMDVTRMSLS